MPGGVKKPKKQKHNKKNIEPEGKKEIVKNKKISLAVRVKKTVKKSKPLAPALMEIDTPPMEKAIDVAVGQEKAQPRARIISEKEESQKNLIMWSGVTFFMILIFVMWIFNMKQQFNQVPAETPREDILANWDEMSQEVDNKLNEMKTGMEIIREISQNVSEEIASGTAPIVPIATTTINSLPDTGTASSTTDKSMELEVLKQRLEQLEKNVNKTN